MSSPVARKERRQKWWLEKQKSRANKREGLRPNPSAVEHFVINTENKGGFKASKDIKSEPSTIQVSKTQSKSLKIPTKGQKKDIKSTDKVSAESKKKNNAVKDKENTTTDNKLKTESQYVLFIGNLPYDVTRENLEDHFRKTGGVKKIRIPQDKAKQRSRGFAYIEFKDRISHGIALRLHHTTMGGRKINVEFTSIGGKNDKRKEKLKKKNEAMAKFKMPLDS